VGRPALTRAEPTPEKETFVELKEYIRDVPDFPKPGILFRDITPLLAHPGAFAEVETRLARAFAGDGITAVAGIESRGFIFGMALARRLEVGFIPIRKEGKLPASRLSETYALEYGEGILEIHDDAAGSGDRVLIVDDLLATGGTAKAAADLVERLGAAVAGLAFVVELSFLKGREKLPGRRVVSLIAYD
jgi:adenine phosphoribosyltransferase